MDRDALRIGRLGVRAYLREMNGENGHRALGLASSTRTVRANAVCTSDVNASASGKSRLRRRRRVTPVTVTDAGWARAAGGAAAARVQRRAMQRHGEGAAWNRTPLRRAPVRVRSGGCQCPPPPLPPLTCKELAAEGITCPAGEAAVRDDDGNCTCGWCACGHWCSPHDECDGEQCNGTRNGYDVVRCGVGTPHPHSEGPRCACGPGAAGARRASPS